MCKRAESEALASPQGKQASLEAQALGRVSGNRQCSPGHRPGLGLDSWYSWTWQVQIDSPSNSTFRAKHALGNQTLRFKNTFLSVYPFLPSPRVKKWRQPFLRAV